MWRLILGLQSITAMRRHLVRRGFYVRERRIAGVMGVARNELISADAIFGRQNESPGQSPGLLICSEPLV
jgi:hypothetical protein